MNRKFQIRTDFYLFWAVAMLVIPFSWLMAWICAVFVHELSHYIALKLLNIQIFQIIVGANGVIMETEEGNDLKMCICALAGPLGGLSLLAFLHSAPRLALCALILSSYNLLPIYPLDGGRAVRGLIQHFFSGKTAPKIICFVEYSAIILILAASIFASFYMKLGLLPIICSVWLILRNKKYLANKVNKRYNSRNRSLRGIKYDTKDTANFTNSAKACPIYRRRI